MADRLPSKFYRVVAHGTGKLRTSERASQTYANKAHAEARVDWLAVRGVDSDLYESEPVVWRKISIDKVPEGQDPLPFD